MFFRGVKVRFCFDRSGRKSSHTFAVNTLFVKGLISLFVAVLFAATAMCQIRYPATRKVDQRDDYHGTTIYDPYRWLENDTSPATSAWVNEQSKFTEAYFDEIPFRHAIRKRLAACYNYTRFGSPFRNGSYFYYYKNDGLQNFPALYREHPGDSVPQVVIDPNELAPDGSVQIMNFVPSKDGKYGAWMMSRSGSDWKTIHIKDLNTLADLTDSLKWIKESDIAWHGDGFYYSRYPEPDKGTELTSENRNQQIWFHKVGTPQSQDKLNFEDPEHPYPFYYASSSDDERFMFVSVVEHSTKGATGNALWYIDHESAEKEFRMIVAEPGENVYGIVDPVDNNRKFLVQTNEGAPNGKIILFDPLRPDKKYWRTVVPERDETMEIASMCGGKMFIKYLKDVSSRLTVHEPGGKFIREIKLPGLGEVDVFRGLADDSVVFYTYRSLNYPTHLYQYHIATGKSSVFHQPELAFNPDAFVTERKFFTSRDGTRIPMFIVHKKNLKRNGSNPTIMYGYGGFNHSTGLPFDPSIIPWIDFGGIYVVVNLRGGGEYGEEWHRAGMLHKKQRVFDDFIAAAEFLINRKYTSPAYLAIRGASNGGLLVGAVTNQRPDLFRVAVPEVAVMDMLRFQKFTIGWNWIAEYGSSDNENDFRNLLSYSPLHNIRSNVGYPAILAVTADHDDRVVPAHSYKYVATMQEHCNGKSPKLLKVVTNTGHGLSSIVKNIELASDIYAFMFFNMGIEWKDPDAKAEEKSKTE